MLEGMENDATRGDDKAYELAQSLWLEEIATVSNKKEAIFSFLDYIELIKSRAKGFMYKPASDESRKKKKILGVLWQISKCVIILSFLVVTHALI